MWHEAALALLCVLLGRQDCGLGTLNRLVVSTEGTPAEQHAFSLTPTLQLAQTILKSKHWHTLSSHSVIARAFGQSSSPYRYRTGHTPYQLDASDLNMAACMLNQFVAVLYLQGMRVLYNWQPCVTVRRP